VSLEVLGNGECVAAVTLHTEWESLDTLKEHPGTVRGETATEVTEWDGTHTEDEGERSEGFWEVVTPTESSVGGIWSVVERVLTGLGGGRLRRLDGC